MSASDPDKAVALETFLLELPEAEAAGVRTAAARIDEIERRIGPPNWIERNLSTLVIATLALFTLGVAAFAGLAAGLGGLFGLGGIVLLLAAFPLLVLVYAWSVRGRTALDGEKMALNHEHFLPRRALYFGARQGGGKVIRIEVDPLGPNLRQRTEALYRASINRRWWW